MIDYIEKEADEAIDSYRNAVGLSEEVVATRRARLTNLLEQADAQAAYADQRSSALNESASQRRIPQGSVDPDAQYGNGPAAEPEIDTRTLARANQVIERLKEALG